MTDEKDYIVNGVKYNLNNIWEYMEKDYWDADDLKFDFWYRLQRHQQIFNEVMERNKMVKSNSTGNDSTDELLKEMKKKNEGLEHLQCELIWDD